MWSVLADGSGYADWVVGARRIRAVDPTWPSTGAHLHHTVGVFPLRFRDTTEVVQSVPTHLLQLRARVRPIGKGVISFTLVPLDDEVSVQMLEVVDRGPASFLFGFWMRRLITVRNRRTLKRLERVVRSLE